MYQGPQGSVAPERGPNIHNFVTTAMGLDGYRVVRNFGIVRGIIVRSRSVIGNLGAAFQQIVGGDITLYTELCEKARADAYERMIQHALQIGANAIIGVRYDATEISSGVTEVLCYGAAVVVEAAPQ
ncbi:MAG: YbjQ family protein [Chloroflexi bacterium]|nr:YbjQ family protein [Chloroflexota bacterium]